MASVVGNNIFGTFQVFLRIESTNLRHCLFWVHDRNVLSGGCPTLHGVVGIGANIKLPLIEELAPGQAWQAGARGYITEFCSALTPEAVEWANRLAAEE